MLKADVHGSLEAVTESLRKLERPEVDLGFVHRAVGGITENDITLAAATNATIIGFNVRPDRKARERRRRRTSRSVCTRYRFDDDLVVGSVDGALAAFALTWYDPVGHVGELEPVGFIRTISGGLSRQSVAGSTHSRRGAPDRPVYSDASEAPAEALRSSRLLPPTGPPIAGTPCN